MVWLPTAGIITSYIGFRSRMPASLISQQNMDILILEDRYAAYPMVTEHNIYAYINIVIQFF